MLDHLPASDIDLAIYDRFDNYVVLHRSRVLHQ